MTITLRAMSLVAGLLTASIGFAQAPAAAPAGSTGLCKDGSYWSGQTKQGACRGHHGVQDWYGAAAAGAGPSTTPAAAAAAAPVAAAAPAAAPAPLAAAPPAAPKTSAPAPTVAAAPGGGPGQVWGNKSSKVYHCPGDRWYGKTKNGAYMTEAEATAQGYHADHGKACHS